MPYIAVQHNREQNRNEMYGPFDTYDDAYEWSVEKGPGISQGIKPLRCKECLQTECVVTCNLAP